MYPSNNLTNGVYNNINCQKIQQKQTTHNSLYALVDHKLQLSSDLEDPNGADDWKSTNSHKSELVITYNNKTGNNTLHPKVLYIVYWTNGDNNGHLIYKLSTNQILVTMKYQPVPVPEDLIELTNKTDSSGNKIRINNFDIKQSIVWHNYSNKNEYDSQIPNNNKDNYEDRDTDELANSQHLDDLKLNKMIMKTKLYWPKNHITLQVYLWMN